MGPLRQGGLLEHQSQIVAKSTLPCAYSVTAYIGINVLKNIVAHTTLPSPLLTHVVYASTPKVFEIGEGQFYR